MIFHVGNEHDAIHCQAGRVVQMSSTRATPSTVRPQIITRPVDLAHAAPIPKVVADNEAIGGQFNRVQWIYNTKIYLAYQHTVGRELLDHAYEATTSTCNQQVTERIGRHTVGRAVNRPLRYRVHIADIDPVHDIGAIIRHINAHIFLARRNIDHSVKTGQFNAASDAERLRVDDFDELHIEISNVELIVHHRQHLNRFALDRRINQLHC